MKDIIIKITVLFVLIYAGLLNAATYNYYFSDDPAGNPTGNDTTGNGSIGNPWKTLSKAYNIIKSHGSNDIVNLYFDRGDTWMADTRNLVGARGIITVYSYHPTTHFNAYGSGNRPVFDGLEDFSSPATTDCTGPSGPCRYSWFFSFWEKNGCSIENFEIKNVYGKAIYIRTSDDVTIRNTKIYNIGQTAIDGHKGSDRAVIEYNNMYLLQRLYETGAYNSWSGGVTFVWISDTVIQKDHKIRYNIIRDVYGEGMMAHGLIEYNIVGNTGSIAIDVGPQNQDAQDTIVRYNLIIQEDWNSNIYDEMSGSGPVGIRIFDEQIGGDNSNANYEIYGNIIINRWNGIWLFCSEAGDSQCGNPYGDGSGSVKLYNNLIIDSHGTNIAITTPEEFVGLEVYNNASILYDRTGAKHAWGVTPGYGWEIDNNAFWTKGSAPNIPSAYLSNAITGDPKLPGELAGVDWDGQTGATYFTNINFSDIYPPANSSLISNGKTLSSGFDDKLLTNGTNWSDDPSASIWQLAAQGSSWDIGAIIYNTGPVNIAPTVNAGTDQTITLPLSATLNGTVTDDGLPNPPGSVTTTWSKQSGPGTVTLGNASAVDTTASFSIEGIYVLRLSADDSDLQTYDDVTITVNPESDLTELIAHYTMDPVDISGGQVLDISGNNNHADINGSPQSSAGKLSESLHFDGADDYLDTNYTDQLNTWTVTVWVRGDSAPGSGMDTGPVMKQENFMISWDHSGGTFREAAGIKTVGGWYASKFGTLSGTTWYHLAATYDGNTLITYLNGQTANSNTAPSGPPDAAAASMKIGRHAVNNNYFAGNIDDVRIFNNALSQPEIEAIYDEASVDTTPPDAPMGLEIIE